MEKTIVTLRVVGIMLGIIVVLLCLSYTNAYGYTASVGIAIPSSNGTLSNSGSPGTTVISDASLVTKAWYRDNIQDGRCDDPDSHLPPVTVPEPSTLVLLGAGLIGISEFVRRRS